MPTKTIEPTGLELRFRECISTPEVADVDAFRARGQATEDGAEDLGILHAGRSEASQDRVAVFLASSDFGIPRPEQFERPQMPDLDSWRLKSTAFGRLAIVSKPRRSAPSVRPAWLFAACLPLVVPAVAHAAPAADPPAVQRPQSEAPPPPILPSPVSEQASETAPESDASPSAPVMPEDVPPALEGSSPIPVVRHEVAPATEAAVPPAIMDAAWEGVDGFMVELQLKGGGRRKGRVGAVQKDTFTLIDATQGQVLVLAKSSVVSLRVVVPPPLPSKTGSGLIAGGSVLLSVGAPTVLTGLVFLGICPSCVELHLPLLMVGAATLGGGIPMVVLGARRRRAYTTVLREHQVLPAVSWTPHGWNGSIRFRF